MSSPGVLSTRPLGATVRLTPDRRVMIRNTAEYRTRDLSNRDLLHGASTICWRCCKWC